MSNKTDEEILYDYYLKINQASRDKAIKLLNERNFKELNDKHIHYFLKKENVIYLKSKLITEVIEELQLISSNIKPNETIPFVYTEIAEYQEDATLYASSHLYSIEPPERCESLAKHYTSQALWKLKYQSSSKECERFRKIILDHRLTTK